MMAVTNFKWQPSLFIFFTEWSVTNCEKSFLCTMYSITSALLVFINCPGK